jgi:hypothetical protein
MSGGFGFIRFCEIGLLRAESPLTIARRGLGLDPNGSNRQRSGGFARRVVGLYKAAGIWGFLYG